MRRAIALAMLILPAVIPAGAGGAELAMAQPSSRDRPALRLTLTSDRPAYAVGQPVTLTLIVENTGTAAVLVTAPSAQLYDFAVFRGDREVWRWSADRGFAAQITEWTLAPGQRREFSETWQPAPGSAALGENIAEATLMGGRPLGVQPLRVAIHVR
jgi:hypothetical protein